MIKFKQNELVSGHGTLELFKQIQKKYNKRGKYKYLKIPFIANSDFSNPVFLFMARYGDMYTMADMELLYECCASMNSWTTANFTRLLAVYCTNVNVLHSDVVKKYYGEIKDIDKLKYNIDKLNQERKFTEDTISYLKEQLDKQARKLSKYGDLYLEIESKIESNKNSRVESQDKVAIWDVIQRHQEKGDHEYLNQLVKKSNKGLEQVYDTIKSGYYAYKKKRTE